MKSTMNPRSSRAKRNNRSARGVLHRPKHTSSSSSQDRAESAAAAAATPATSEVYQDYLHDVDEVEALASQACALASVPATPHYFENDDDWDQSDDDEVYRTALEVDYGDEGEVYYSDDEVNYNDECEIADNSMALASKTSTILSNYKDFMLGMENDVGNDLNVSGRGSLDGDTTEISALRTPDNISRGADKFAGGSRLLRGFQLEKNLHDVSFDEDNQVEAASFLGRNYSYSWFKKLKADAIVLMIICLVAVSFIGGYLNNQKDHSPEIELNPKETLHCHLSDDIVLKSNASQQLFDRSMGWDGKTYHDAIAFCGKQEYTLCPYNVICPGGAGNTSDLECEEANDSWSAIIDVPNGWVQTAYKSTYCMEYNSLNKHPPVWNVAQDTVSSEDMTPHVMCCKEPIQLKDPEPPSMVYASIQYYEQDVMDEMHPVWFERKHGYYGTNHSEAASFCKGVGDMVLCPADAYCPSDPSMQSDQSAMKLFLNREPFDGEQWAPVAPESGKDDIWLSVGNNSDTCFTYEHIYSKPPEWGMDNSRPDIKENVLCCQKPAHSKKEERLKKSEKPMWIDASHGWGYNGWSHQNAVELCESFLKRKLCSYYVYCPNGEGQAAMGEHTTDFNAEGEQWAPVFGDDNHWVMIGQKYQNSATTCMQSDDLPMPDWSNMTNDGADVKKHILCCSY